MKVGLACAARIRETYLDPADVARLQGFAELVTRDFDVPPSAWGAAVSQPSAEAALAEFSAGLDALVVCHGAPRVTEAVFAAAPLRLVGELEGDRFAGRIDLAAAARHRVPIVDTTHGSSYPVAEWALASMIRGLRALPDRRELTGKRIGLIGFGHIGWRLVELLRPFDVDVVVSDPYAPREIADALNVTFAPLEVVLSRDVVMCLAPLTEETRGMLGSRELGTLHSGSVFVNVSRGAIVDSEALTERLRVGDVVACLDVFDPEPVPDDAPIRLLPNVFLSPHVAGTTLESRTRFFALMVDELARVAAGAEPRAVLTARVTAGRHGGG